jgi:hypothetical protein
MQQFICCMWMFYNRGGTQFVLETPSVSSIISGSAVVILTPLWRCSVFVIFMRIDRLAVGVWSGASEGGYHDENIVDQRFLNTHSVIMLYQRLCPPESETNSSMRIDSGHSGISSWRSLLLLYLRLCMSQVSCGGCCRGFGQIL